MPLRVLHEWIAYRRLEPFGPKVDEERFKIGEYQAFVRAGTITANLLNMWSRRGARRIKVMDFVPEHARLDPPSPNRPAEDPASLYQKLKMAFGLVSK